VSKIVYDDVEIALLEAVWLMRWNKDKTALSAVLSVKEAEKMCKDIRKELKKAGYTITKIK